LQSHPLFYRIIARPRRGLTKVFELAANAVEPPGSDNLTWPSRSTLFNR
jgi:hypothetical protein